MNTPSFWRDPETIGFFVVLATILGLAGIGMWFFSELMDILSAT